MKKLPLLLVILFMGIAASAREVYDLNRGWKFYTCDERDSIRVGLPHTWNGHDALAGRMDYYRGTGNYLKYLRVKPQWKGKRVFIRFYGAGTVADLLVNGRHAGSHRGGNNAFEFEITDYLDYDGRNLLWVIVSNSSRLDVLPTAGEDNVYGGLFRDAQLIVTEPTAIGFDGYGGIGAKFSATRADSVRADGKVYVSVNSLTNRSVDLGLRIYDASDSLVYEGHAKHRASSGLSVAQLPFGIDAPRLWNGTADPYLYTVAVTLTDANRNDSVSFRTGIRSFGVDAAEGFFLNGAPYPLRGVVLWRDQAVYGPVFSDEHLRRDVAIMKEMGANAVRVAGGTHHPKFYDICDEEGVIVLADGPFIGSATLDSRGYYNTDSFKENAEIQLRELICQRYNNPSVMFWGIFAEPELIGDDPLPFIRHLTGVARELDPLRLTVGVSNKDGEVNRITDLIVWNHTFGWKGGLPTDIAIWLDQLRADPLWNKLCSAVSYRAEGTPGHFAEKRVAGFVKGSRTENVQALVHEAYVNALARDSALWAVFAGDMFDHGSTRYASDGKRGVNGCGLVTFDRNLRKDAFWLYKANWNKEDFFLHIASKRHTQRRSNVQDLTVYSNMSQAELFIDEVSVGVRKARNGVMRWEGVQLVPGENRISVQAVAFTADGPVTVCDSMAVFCDPDGLP